MIAYEEALDALARGFVPMIVPRDDDEGVILFRIKPGPAMVNVSQSVREKGHVYMAAQCHKRLAQLDAEQDD